MKLNRSQCLASPRMHDRTLLEGSEMLSPTTPTHRASVWTRVPNSPESQPSPVSLPELPPEPIKLSLLPSSFLPSHRNATGLVLPTPSPFVRPPPPGGGTVAGTSLSHVDTLSSSCRVAAAAAATAFLLESRQTYTSYPSSGLWPGPSLLHPSHTGIAQTASLDSIVPCFALYKRRQSNRA
jgi:hypothetical protein